ncbi:MAG: hypothetical protein GXO79_13870 [Chlorobi bacterium]|nr:hypothetical protein [Chlorobiota bacterium]
MSILLEDHLNTVEIPANLRINDQIKQYRKKCADMGCTRPYYHFAFGQSPFSPLSKIVEALKNHANQHDYLPTAGILEFRSAIAKYCPFIAEVINSINRYFKQVRKGKFPEHK